MKIVKINFNELDGELNGVVEYGAQLAMSPLRKNPFDADNFYPFEGKSCACGCGGEAHSSILGGLIPSKAELQRNRAMRQQRRNLQVQSKAQTRVAKSQGKLAQGKSQQIAAQNIGKDTASDRALAAALSSSGTANPAAKKGLSTGAKIGIGAGIFVVVAVGGYFIYKAVKKKK